MSEKFSNDWTREVERLREENNLLKVENATLKRRQSDEERNVDSKKQPDLPEPESAAETLRPGQAGRAVLVH